jgi:NAD(P)-dependent dehydrogenase (short-subunit alcohol dehydrogenase family)
MQRLENRAALITGAASGIGRGTALLFAAEGAAVVAADINREGAEQTVAMIEAQGGKAIACMLDVTDEASWEGAIADALAAYGKVNIVCNNAGITAPQDFEDLALARWNREIGVNLTGVFLGCQYGIRAIKQNGEPGAIVNLGSISGLGGVASTAAYCASKGGVRMLTKAVALHCAKKGYRIRCNAVNPSYVDTAMFDPAVPMFGDRGAMLDEFAKDIPMGRVATAEDVARAILFLSTDDSAMVTGSEIVVDGGHTAGFAVRYGR